MGEVAFKALGKEITIPNWPGDILKTGKWVKAGPEEFKFSKQLFAEGKPVLLSAKVEFKYVGGKMPGPGGSPTPIPPPPNDVLMLDPPTSMGKAEAQLKTDTSKLVLIKGDIKKSPFLNELKVSKFSTILFTS
jgi:hypothetical protein